jgi:hypothetical protein
MIDISKKYSVLYSQELTLCYFFHQLTIIAIHFSQEHDDWRRREEFF